MGNKLLTVKEVSKVFDCSLSHAYDIVGQRDFPKVQIGKRIYVVEEELFSWLKRYTYKKYKVI